MPVYLWPDVSNVNGHPIDGALAKAQGMSAVTAKATEGLGFKDSLLAANHAQAKAAGLPFMAYHYPHTGNGAGQADFFVAYVAEQCGGLEGIALMIDREDCDAATADAFIVRLRQIAPHNALSGYEAQWVTDRFGQSAQMDSLPLLWSDYVSGSGTPFQRLANVTPNWMIPFAGHTSYAARQFTDTASVGGISPCDVNVCYDTALFERLFGLTPVVVPAPISKPASPVAKPVVIIPAPAVPAPTKESDMVSAVEFANEFHTYYVNPAGELITVWKTKTGSFNHSTIASGCAHEAPCAAVWNNFVNVYVRAADGKGLIHRARPAKSTDATTVWTGQVVAV